jgi:transglutaminase-like putative cysteine protease
MQLLCESRHLQDYLAEQDVIDSAHPLVLAALQQLSQPAVPETERVRQAFEFVRDRIQHSWDLQSPRVTCRASEVLRSGEGLCYAKAHLLAALLRIQGIPTGLCYQRLAQERHFGDGLRAAWPERRLSGISSKVDTSGCEWQQTRRPG